MKLLFIENRYKTFLLEAVAKSLSAEHEIFWIVQNHSFSPKTGEYSTIPYPQKSQLSSVEIDHNIDYDNIITSDRQINFFEKKDTNYVYYYTNQIASRILKINPDFVFGEATAFHELITIELCKKFGLHYLNLSTCRYPIGRFSFYNYESLQPYKGSNENLEGNSAQTMIDAIANRTVNPDYMKKVAISRQETLKDKIKLIVSYYSGERFNTPSPLIKLKLERTKKESIKEWYTIAQHKIDSSKKAILFPLHMQPEANIDVWGRQYRDQLDTIKNIHKSLLTNQILYVKPNPKSKYELSTELIEYIKTNTNIVALRHDLPMSEIFDDIDLVITITGTIAIECILTNKPVITLVKTLNNDVANCLYSENFETLKSYLELIDTDRFPTISNEEQINFLNKLNQLSFKGIISDPRSDPNCISKENVQDIKNAIELVINEY